MNLKNLLWNDNTARLLQDAGKALQSGAGALSSLMDASARRSAQAMGEKSSGEGWEKLLQTRGPSSPEEEEHDASYYGPTSSDPGGSPYSADPDR